MKVHFLNCGLMHPRLAPVFVPHLERVPCLCLLLEDEGRLVLVDTGFGTLDVADPLRLGRFGACLLNPRMEPGLTAREQVKRLGFDPGEVGDIICTHLDRDHAGGLSDFPHARVHVLKEEREAALSPGTPRERERYRPCHFAHGPLWETYDEGEGEEWWDLKRIPLRGLPEGLFLVPLRGHTRGHCGVAVDTGEGWLLHCGDAFYVKEELREGSGAPLGVAGFRAVAHVNLPLALYQLVKLRSLLDDVVLIAAHDQFEYRYRLGRPLD
ncbi:MAG: MBL fold metallo-hydrolase [Actinobacteria bacterium]|nr:MBL fold metallo-hydrolase [Actinomycetota bacterium]